MKKYILLVFYSCLVLLLSGCNCDYSVTIENVTINELCTFLNDYAKKKNRYPEIQSYAAYDIPFSPQSTYTHVKSTSYCQTTSISDTYWTCACSKTCQKHKGPYYKTLQGLKQTSNQRSHVIKFRCSCAKPCKSICEFHPAKNYTEIFSRSRLRIGNKSVYINIRASTVDGNAGSDKYHKKETLYLTFTSISLVFDGVRNWLFIKGCLNELKKTYTIKIWSFNVLDKLRAPA